MREIFLVLIALAGNTSMAHAQSNVTVYGLVDLGLAKTTGGDTVMRENRASRLGFRGSEDLAVGYTIIFTLETEVLADTGAQKGVLFERHAYVGVKGSFGTLYMGRTKDIMDGAISRIDPFGTNGIVGKVIEPIMRSGVGTSRAINAITYNSSDFSGFGISLQTVLSEVTGMNSGASVLVTYSKGATTAHAGFQRLAKKGESAAPTLFSVGATYNFGPLKVSAGCAHGSPHMASNEELKSSMFGAIYTAGLFEFKAVAGRQIRFSNQFSGLESVREIGVGFDYHLSKRTDFYAYSGKEKVKSLTSYQAGLSHKF